MPPRERHLKIFGVWAGLKTGECIVLVNDHDPVPLYYQFNAEHTGRFRWKYEERGPEVFRVRITKGNFADSGFVPAGRAGHSCSPSKAVPIDFVKPLRVDTRPIFARGESPLGAIDEAAANLILGQTLVLIVPFEPVPLYARLGRQGFTHRARPLGDGGWQVEFQKTGGRE